MGFPGGRVVVLVLAMVLGAGSAWPQGSGVHRVGPATQKIDLASHAPVLQDLSGELTAGQVAVLAAAGGMQRMDRPQASIRRIQADNTMWVKLDVQADAGSPADWLLEVGYPMHEHARLFILQNDGTWAASSASGAAVAHSDREIPHASLVFPVHITPGNTVSMLLRMQDHGEALIMATLWQADAMHASWRVSSGFYLLYFGLFGGMWLYNLLLYVVMRDRTYLYYLGFISCAALGVAGNTGLGGQHIWGNWGTWWNSRTALVGYSAMIAFSAVFTRRFLLTGQRLPRLDKVLVAVAWTAGIAAAASALLNKHVAAMLLLPAVFTMSIMAVTLSVIALRRRWTGAAYFCAAYLSFHVLAFMGASRFSQLFALPLSVPAAIALGSALEMILLSLALADRINQETLKKERAQALSLTLLNASQSLSRERSLERLSDRVCAILSEVTGADKVHFILCRTLAQDRGLVNPAADIPRRVLDHVLQGRQTINIADVLLDARFRDDPAFHGVPGCAVLGLPIVHQGVMVAVLLLERRGRHGAFAQTAVLAMEVVAGPLAVLLENVLLYEELEQRVTEQTRQLQDAQKDLEAAARRAGKAEVANSVLHNVGNLLNSVNTSAQLVNSKVLQSRSQGLARAVDLIESHTGGLGDFMERDPRGKVLPDYLNKLVTELARERDEVIAELANLRRGVHHIRAVVAMQQTEATA